MNLIYLHGPPAAGKLTIARELAARIDAKVLDNHASIEFAQKLFDFGAPGFWELVHDVRFAALRQAVASSLQYVIVTQVYTEPDDRPIFEQTRAIVEDANGALLPVFLRCDIATLHQRICNPDRVERGKLHSVARLDDVLSRWRIASVPHARCITLDSAAQQPADAADTILKHFGLGPAPE